ncbi:MAG: hypothetical protein C0481_16005 [Phenylobacterium sp.]|nr:hypothetical protein [Phenylobacterium sp.]
MLRSYTESDRGDSFAAPGLRPKKSRTRRPGSSLGRKRPGRAEAAAPPHSSNIYGATHKTTSDFVPDPSQFLKASKKFVTNQ